MGVMGLMSGVGGMSGMGARGAMVGMGSMGGIAAMSGGMSGMLSQGFGSNLAMLGGDIPEDFGPHMTGQMAMNNQMQVLQQRILVGGAMGNLGMNAGIHFPQQYLHNRGCAAVSLGPVKFFA